MKKLPVIALFVSLGLSGCVASQSNVEAEAPKDDVQCRSMGYRPGTDSYLQCRKMFMDQHRADAQAQAAELNDFGQRLREGGAALQASQQPAAVPQQTLCHAASSNTVMCQSF
jgi:hypothetical protein